MVPAVPVVRGVVFTPSPPEATASPIAASRSVSGVENAVGAARARVNHEYLGAAAGCPREAESVVQSNSCVFARTVCGIITARCARARRRRWEVMRDETDEMKGWEEHLWGESGRSG